MNTNAKLGRLAQIYRLYDEFTGDADIACREGCAACCTRNVTMTSLEGRYLVGRLDADGRRALQEQIVPLIEAPRFQPQVTTNGLAEICMSGGEPPEEICDPTWTPCPLLTDDLCPVYDLRPLGCRCMSSRQVCTESGAADMDDYLLTVNNVMLQVIEHLDAGGCTGNMIDMLDALLVHTGDETTVSEVCGQSPFIPNIPIKMLMVPPDHQPRIRPLLERLNALL